MVLLDTNIIVEHLAGRFDLAPKVIEIGAPSCYISSIVVYELLHGALRSARAEEYMRVETLLEGFARVPFDDSCAKSAAKIRFELDKQGLGTGHSGGAARLTSPTSCGWARKTLHSAVECEARSAEQNRLSRAVGRATFV